METNSKKTDDIKIKKYLKSYLSAKKYNTTDNDKSIAYFKQCIKILNDIKDDNIYVDDNIVNIFNETEIECNKMITDNIELVIDTPIKIKDIEPINKEDNELFEMIETGNINKLKEYNYGELKITYDNNGNTPLHFAIKYGDTLFLKHAFKLGLKIDQTNKLGYTLLEFACLEKDPNMINFLILYGADMKKHLKLREGRKYYNNGNQIDILLLEKMIIDIIVEPSYEIKYLNWIFQYIDKNEIISLEKCVENNSTLSESKITFLSFINNLDFIINNFNNDSKETYLMILKEELNYNVVFKLGCPISKIEILLYNLIPFINYNFNLNLDWLLSLEIKFIILKILKNNVNINIKKFKNELSDILYNSYIKTNLVSEGLIKNLVLQWLYKIKV